MNKIRYSFSINLSILYMWELLADEFTCQETGEVGKKGRLTDTFLVI